LSGFNGPSIFSTDFRKKIRYKISENPFSESRIVPCRKTGRHDEANIRLFAIFAERAYNSAYVILEAGALLIRIKIFSPSNVGLAPGRAKFSPGLPESFQFTEFGFQIRTRPPSLHIFPIYYSLIIQPFDHYTMSAADRVVK